MYCGTGFSQLRQFFLEVMAANNENILQLLERSSRYRQLFCVSAFFWLNLSVGFAQGLTVAQIPSLSSDEDLVKMDEEELSWFASLGFIASILGHLLGGFIANKFGRKTGATIIYPFFISGFLLSGLGTIALLYVGRGLAGVASGLQAASTSSYYSEVTSPNLRMTVHSSAMVANCVGVLLPIVFTRFTGSWRLFAVIASSAPILGFIHIFFIPESPAWLVLRGKLKKAKRSLKKIRGPEYPHDVEIDHLKQSLISINGDSNTPRSILQRIKDPDVWKPFIIVNMTFVLQVWTGFAILRAYTIVILQASGSRLNPYDITLVSRCFTTLGQFLCTLVNTRLGRRTIFILSGFFSAISLAGLGISVGLHPCSTELFSQPNSTAIIETCVDYHGILNFLPAIFLCSYCLSYCLGVGPIPWMYSNELYPTDLRSVLYSFAACLVPLQNFLGSKTLPDIMSSLGLTYTLFMFGGVSLLCVFWGFFVLPETKGLTLHEINLLFRDKQAGAKFCGEQGRYSAVHTIIRSRTISE